MSPLENSSHSPVDDWNDEDIDDVHESEPSDEIVEDKQSEISLSQELLHYLTKLFPVFMVASFIIGTQILVEKYRDHYGMTPPVSAYSFEFLAECQRVIEVMPGDTLSGIADSVNTTVDELALKNNIPDPDNISAGNLLCVDGLGTADSVAVAEEDQVSTEPVQRDDINENSGEIEITSIDQVSHEEPVAEKFWNSTVFEIEPIDLGIDFDLDLGFKLKLDEISRGEALFALALLIAMEEFVRSILPAHAYKSILLSAISGQRVSVDDDMPENH